jgi:hypothetical protein
LKSQWRFCFPWTDCIKLRRIAIGMLHYANTNTARRFRKPTFCDARLAGRPPRLHHSRPAPIMNTLVRPCLFVVAKVLVLGNTFMQQMIL